MADTIVVPAVAVDFAAGQTVSAAAAEITAIDNCRREASGGMAGPLEGITVADFTTAHQGPWATQKLGEMGAEVVKIERLGGEWARNLTTGG